MFLSTSQDFGLISKIFFINYRAINISVPISLKANLKLQVKAVTQSPGLCYAGCYAKLFYANKKRRKCYTGTRYNASYKVVR